MRILLLILFLIFAIFLLYPAFQELPSRAIEISAEVPIAEPNLDLPSFLFGAVLVGCVGYLVFRIRVWRSDANKIFEARKASLKDGPSAFKVMSDSLVSLLFMVGIVGFIFVVVMEYIGRHEDLVAMADWIATKGGRLVEVLTH